MNESIMLIGNILGLILQPLYTCLLILYTKEVKNRRIYFIILNLIYYIIVQNTLTFRYGIVADLIYVVLMYLNLKILYNNKARITDLTTYIISDFVLGMLSMISYFIFGMNFIGLMSALMIPIILLIIFKSKLPIIEKFYNKFWNRKKQKMKIKSITTRGISLCITVFLTLILHFWMLYLLFK